MSFSTDLQGPSSHKALLNLQDFEINFFEGIKKFLTSRIKLDQEYAKNLSSLSESAQKFDISEICTPLSKIWVSILEQLSSISEMMLSSCMRLNDACIKKLDDLVSVKKTTKKLYIDQKNKLETELHRLDEEVKKNTNSYEKHLQKLNSAKLKLNQLEGRGQSSSKFEEVWGKMTTTNVKLHSVHNSYVLSLLECNLYQKHFSCVLLPGLLDEHQNLMETSIKKCQKLLQECFQATNFSGKKFQDAQENIARLLSSINSTVEYSDFVIQFRSDPVVLHKNEFSSALINSSHGSTSETALLADEFTADELLKVEMDMMGEVLLIKQNLAEKRKELEMVEELKVTEDERWEFEISLRSFKREIFELQCHEERCNILVSTVSAAINLSQIQRSSRGVETFDNIENDSKYFSHLQHQNQDKSAYKSIHSQFISVFGQSKSLRRGRKNQPEKKIKIFNSVGRKNEIGRAALAGYEEAGNLRVPTKQSHLKIKKHRSNSLHDSTAIVARTQALGLHNEDKVGNDDGDEAKYGSTERDGKCDAFQDIDRTIEQSTFNNTQLSKRSRSEARLNDRERASEGSLDGLKLDCSKLDDNLPSFVTTSGRKLGNKLRKGIQMIGLGMRNESAKSGIFKSETANVFPDRDNRIRGINAEEETGDGNSLSGDEDQGSSSESLRARLASKLPPPPPPQTSSKPYQNLEISIETEEWYHGLLPRDDVHFLLEKDGDFLVRTTRNKSISSLSSPNPDKPQQYVLSVFCRNCHKHFIIQESDEGYHFEDETYPTIKGLLQAYIKTGLSVTEKSRAVIRNPVCRQSWELSNSDIQLLNRIGSGQFGEVYKGILKLTTETPNPSSTPSAHSPQKSPPSSKPAVPPKPSMSSSQASAASLVSPTSPAPSSNLPSSPSPHPPSPTALPSSAPSSRKKMLVAVKICKDSLDDENRIRFLKEAKILKLYNHLNIVKFVGVATLNIPIMIVMEYVKGGSLLNFVRTHQSLKVSILLKMCLHIASGMTYLESKNCIHRDLAARNCLVSLTDDEMNEENYDNISIKISDFGMSKVEEEYTITAGTRQIPIKWTAPEALTFGKYTIASDVWSFGVVVWELFSYGKVPYQGMSNALASEMVEKGHRLPQTDNMPAPLYELLLRCWYKNLEERPNFSRILNDLQGIDSESS